MTWQHPEIYCAVYTFYSPRAKKQEQCGRPIGKYPQAENERITGYMATRQNATTATPMCIEHASRAGQAMPS